MDKMLQIVAVLFALSLASERLVEIVKTFLFKSLLVKKDEAEEARRQAKIQCLAVFSGLITASLAAPAFGPAIGLKTDLQYLFAIPVLGLLASGGSGLWNSVLGYLKGVKDFKQCQAEEQRMDVAAEKKMPKAA